MAAKDIENKYKTNVNEFTIVIETKCLGVLDMCIIAIGRCLNTAGLPRIAFGKHVFIFFIPFHYYHLLQYTD